MTREEIFLILKEIERRNNSKFVISDYCFNKQLDFIEDTARFKTAVCSRRAGKTISCAVHLLTHAKANPERTCLYITLDRKNAKRIIWRDITKINKEYRFGFKTNETELTLTHPNGSVIYISGAKDKSEIEKFRGLAISLVYVDECFHPDTLIGTPLGEKRISEIKVGDEVYNANGIGVVTEVTSKILDKHIELEYGGKKIKCSLNHPFFTDRGWVNASDLKIGDNLATHNISVQLLQNSYRKDSIWKSENTKFLQHQLLKESDINRNIKEDVSKKSNEKRRNKGESFSYIKEDESQAAYPWWKWLWANRARKNIIGSIQKHKMESCGWIGNAWKWLSIKLQAGFSFCFNKIRNRSGWSITPAFIKKITGQEKGHKAGFIRLDGIKIYKFGSDRTNAEGRFYDLGVSGHPSFVVNGALVHNCQSFRSYIEDLVDDILGAALFDYNGTLCLIGTPGLVPTGYFHKCATSTEWSHHHWTMFDNPHLEKKSGRKIMDLVHEDMRRMGVDINHPKIQRECFGRWVIDTESMVLHYVKLHNHYDHVESLAKWNYVIGVDIGYDDADAICVIGWRDHNPQAYLLEEIVVKKQGITELAGQIQSLYDRFNPMKIVMDTGGLGKKIGEELTKRFALPITAAEKARKYEFLELLDDALRTGNFKAKSDSAFAQDCLLTEWDMEKKKKGILEISDKYHSDIIDAVLYAYREAMHWIEIPVEPKIEKGSKEYFEKIERDMFDQAFQSTIKKDDDLMEDFM